MVQLDALLASSTRAWVEAVAGPGARVLEVARLIGGWTSEMRRLRVQTSAGQRELVLRSFTKPFFVQHAQGLLEREAAILELLAGTAVPAARLVAVDARAEHCAFPSLLRSHLPGRIALEDDAGAGERVAQLAAQLLAIHRVPLAADQRPRPYQAWTRADAVKIPEHTGARADWQRAVDVIRQPAPAHEGCFLHRDFHPGNVLFDAEGSAPRICGVVDWVETSWGPADLDVAHCSTALALLHGAEAGLHFPERYTAAGGRLAADPRARLYWSLLDALHYAPDGEKLVTPWREAGRGDLSPELVRARIEHYVLALLAAYS